MATTTSRGQQAPPSAPEIAPPGDLDQRTWAYRTTPRAALAHSFVLRTDDASLGRYCDAIMSGFPTASSAQTVYSIFECPDLPGWYALYVDDRQLRFTPAPFFVLEDLVWHINQRTIERSADYTLLHASAAERGGIAAIFPAAMESGKTTLVAGLLQRGFAYFTDEAAAIAPADQVLHPYPKPLSVDPGSWELLPDLAPVLEHGLDRYVVNQWHVPVPCIPTSGIARPTRPRLLVTPKYEAGATTELRRLRRAEMLKVLLLNTFHFRAHARRDLAVLAELVRGADCYAMRVGDLGAACDVVEQLVDTLEDEAPDGRA